MEKQNKSADKITEKAFSRLMITSVLGILVCIMCLCMTTYAWFTGNVSSGNNEIKSASECLLSVSVYKDGEEEAVANVDLENAVTRVCDEGVYTVTLTLPKESASGYLVLTVGDDAYYTDYLYRSDSTDQTLTFTLYVEAAQSVTFTARWGIYSGTCHVENNGTLTIGAIDYSAE